MTLSLRVLIDAMHARLAEDGFADLRPAHGYVLNAAQHGDATASDIAGTLGITKQGAAKVIAELVDAGYVTRKENPADGRARPVALTSRGARALEAAVRHQREIEAEWTELTSARDMAALRRVLDTVLRASDGGEDPPLRPAW